MQQAKYYITTCLLAIAFTINAQLPTGPEIAWQRCYGTSGGDNFFDAIVTSDNSIVASIYYGGYDGDATGLFSLSLPAGLIKFDSDFNVIWQNFFGGSDNISYFKKWLNLIILILRRQVILLHMMWIFQITMGIWTLL
ncbi:MAG: hypothetical protein IPG60_15900 [Bacteroidetes bacterium]|nr:hypothetical protein [Bacteroidota bacterium]